MSFDWRQGLRGAAFAVLLHISNPILFFDIEFFHPESFNVS